MSFMLVQTKNLTLLFISLASMLCAQCKYYHYEIINVKNSATTISTYGNDIYTYAKRACYSDNFDDAQGYARQAKSAADDAVSETINAENYASNAESYAADCKCDEGESYASSAYAAATDAHTEADDAYTYARRAYYSDNLEDVQYNARRAMSTANDVISKAEEIEHYATLGEQACH
jgi:hypothetical protein